uniref:Uncharacterized protein n=1 Tax=uncultured Acidobacteriota bacterium TaxID=171953 RepID=Q7X2Y2_9BACT|nr:hypothetical protein [uncultured Acidobacteriota bacterium]
MLKRLLVAVLLLVAVAALAATALAYWLFAGDGVRQALEQQASTWLGQPVQIASARVAILPRPGLRLSDVKVGGAASLSLSAIDIATDLGALLRRRIENARIEISSSRLELPIALPTSGGGGAPTASGDATSDASASVIEVASISEIALRDVTLASHGREITVSASAGLDGNRLIVRRFTATSGLTTLDALGEVDLAPRVDARLKVAANRLDVDELLALAAAFSPAAAARPAASTPPPRVAARVSAESATAGGVEIRQFATDFELNGDAVALSPLTFQLFGGRYQGSMNATMGRTLSASIRSRIMDLDVAQLAAFGGAEGTMTGRLTGAGTFKGSGADMAGLLASVEGSGTAEIVKGTIARLGLVRAVVVFFGKPDPGAPAASDAFDRMDISFSMANGVARADAFAMRSQDADVVGSGRLETSSKSLDGQLDLSLSEQLSAQAGTDLRRYTREGNRIVLPARLAGTLEQPALRIDAAAAVTRGLRNELDRRLGGLLDRFKQ